MDTHYLENYLVKLRKFELGRKLKRALVLMFSHLSESLFLGIANKLPRNPLSDRAYSIFLRLSGVNIGYKSIIWAPLDIRPIGAAKNIVIGDRVFINSGVRFGCPPPGKIIIGKGSVIAAGSVVTKDIPPFSLAAGVPARVIRKLKDQ
jgi:hypothetical protein